MVQAHPIIASSLLQVLEQSRSFLMQFGLHHVGTIQELLKDEDLLMYMRTLD